MSEPVFPMELEREIFETTALMHPKAGPTLLRVARRVLVWIEPLLYRIVILNSQNEKKFLPLLIAMECKQPEFFHAVHHLAVWYYREMCTVEELTRLLTLCKRVVDLSFGNLTDPDLLPIIADMPLQRLSLSLQELFGSSPDLKHPLFDSVTHLDICDRADRGAAISLAYAQIPALPALTRLALEFHVPKEVALTLLEECPPPAASSCALAPPPATISTRRRRFLVSTTCVL
ncbi:hypothetical protein MVEN_00494300 [Mycena venus]|uniref:Uncharacterized protein n=1 Tax=Mycena venus TaxID=2733690 RepID=A0A8H6YTR0_9AGAR|nr:hypothetical protein MVEN_00494300 [Mycena venus]